MPIISVLSVETLAANPFRNLQQYATRIASKGGIYPSLKLYRLSRDWVTLFQRFMERAMSQFVADWIKGERDNHSRLLYQLKRELAEMRRDASASKPDFLAERSRIDKSDRPSTSDRPSSNDRPSTDERSGERPVVRTPIPAQQVMYR